MNLKLIYNDIIKKFIKTLPNYKIDTYNNKYHSFYVQKYAIIINK